MNRSILSKLIGFIALVLLIVFIVIYFFIANEGGRVLLQSFERESKLRLYDFKEAVKKAGKIKLSFKQGNAFLRKKLPDNWSFLVLNGDDDVIYRLRVSDKNLEEMRSWYELDSAKKGNESSDRRIDPTTGGMIYTFATPIALNGKKNMVLIAYRPMSGFYSRLKNFRLKYILLFGAGYLLLLTLIVLFLSRLLRPVYELTMAAERAASGKTDARVFLKDDDEYKTLADFFNNVMEKQQVLISDLRSEKESLNAIMTAMNEALWVTDEKGKILFSNRAFCELLGDTPTGKYDWQVLRNNTFDGVIRSVRQKKDVLKEIMLFDKPMLLSAHVIRQTGRVIFLLYDLSVIREAESMKRHLVSSVSHELKTPLTSILGFLEALREEKIDDEARHYLNVIERNAQRLNYIVRDLLILNELEEEKKPEYEECDLQHLVNTVLELLKPKAMKKALSLNYKVSVSGLFKCDAFQIEQLLINLVDNAIKYSEKGEIDLNISQNKRFVVIKVSDNGCGIPQKSLGKIFERFYVVDKSRSRLYGGTGLGLSIVKHIVRLHHGHIDVESRVGRGSVFTVMLPVNGA